MSKQVWKRLGCGNQLSVTSRQLSVIGNPEILNLVGVHSFSVSLLFINRLIIV
jgi:hypothetical protein